MRHAFTGPHVGLRYANMCFNPSVHDETEVAHLLDLHFHRNFNREGRKLSNLSRKRRLFAFNFTSQVHALGGTAACARDLLEELTDLQDYEGEPRGSSLSVQYPFDLGLVYGLKKLELRKCRLGKRFAKKHVVVYVNESGSEPKFRPASNGYHFPPKVPGKVVGAVTLLGTWIELIPSGLTPEVAAAAMLSLEGLKKAYADGYKFAWHVGYGKSFEHPPVGKDMAATQRMCQVWTTMSEPPRKKLRVAAALR